MLEHECSLVIPQRRSGRQRAVLSIGCHRRDEALQDSWTDEDDHQENYNKRRPVAPAAIASPTPESRRRCRRSDEVDLRRHITRKIASQRTLQTTLTFFCNLCTL